MSAEIIPMRQKTPLERAKNLLSQAANITGEGNPVVYWKIVDAMALITESMNQEKPDGDTERRPPSA